MNVLSGNPNCLSRQTQSDNTGDRVQVCFHVDVSHVSQRAERQVLSNSSLTVFVSCVVVIYIMLSDNFDDRLVIQLLTWFTVSVSFSMRVA